MISLVKGSEYICVQNFDELFDLFKDKKDTSETVMGYVMKNYKMYVAGIRYEE
jgi:hypothetical protein